jgi:L-asparaginase
VRTVHVLTTGGTIEKIYSESRGSVENLESKVERYLKRLRLPDTRVDVAHLMNKDSLEMTDSDRQFVLAAVEAKLTGKNPIVITHGTDTMVETGRFLRARLPDVQVPIVLTGAMTPLGFEETDALQNLTEALFATRLLPAGVWIVMHGQFFPADQARKDRDLARFVAEPKSSKNPAATR